MTRSEATSVLEAMLMIARASAVAARNDYERKIAGQRSEALSYALEEMHRVEGLEK